MDYTPAQYFQPQLFPHLNQRKGIKKYTLKPVDVKVLEAIYKLRFMNIEHIRRYLGQSSNSLPKLRQRLAILSGKSTIVLSDAYLQRFYQPRETPFVNLPLVYALGTPGKAELSKLGYDIAVYENQRKIITRLPYELDHHFAINELLIAALHLSDIAPSVEVFDFQHDFMLKHHPEKFQVSIYKGAATSVLHPAFSPDAIIDFRLLRPGQKPIPRRLVIEMDMGTHEADSFKRKIACYQDFFASGMYKTHFDNIKNVSVLFVTPKGEKRRDKMRLWTQQQYERPLYTSLHAKEEDVKKFLFAAVPAGALEPEATFLQSLCYPVFPKQAHLEPIIQLPTEP
jgi:Replication-relaxation